MTGVVIVAAGLAGVHEGPGDIPPAGAFLVSYDPDAHDGRGAALWARLPDEAMVFVDHVAAMSCWRSRSQIRPTRSDGRPNRPLTSMNIEVVADPLGRSAGG